MSHDNSFNFVAVKFDYCSKLRGLEFRSDHWIAYFSILKILRFLLNRLAKLNEIILDVCLRIISGDLFVNHSGIPGYSCWMEWQTKKITRPQFEIQTIQTFLYKIRSIKTRENVTKIDEQLQRETGSPNSR